jgi:hypothetical protein
MAGTLTVTTISGVSTLNAPSGVLATQNGMTGIAKAWVQFSATGGTITTNASFNVSSVTRQGTGLYTVNMTTAMSSANYNVVMSNSAAPGASDVNCEIFTTSGSAVTAPTASAFILATKVVSSGTFYDCAYVTATVFGA